MDNYITNTPVYKIWTDAIELLATRTSFLVQRKGFGFIKVICSQEDVKQIYIKGNIELRLIFAYTSSFFYCSITEANTNNKINWKNSPPEMRLIKNKESLIKEIEIWLEFINNNL